MIEIWIIINIFRPDYAPWSGPDPNLLTKEMYNKTIANGHDASLLFGNRYVAKGPNPELRKGPLRELTQGSIYSQRNVSNTESRGKWNMCNCFFVNFYVC